MIRPPRNPCPALLGAALLALSPMTAVAQEDEGAEFEEHEALFLIEEAYTQEDGEWQVGLALVQSLQDTAEREWEIEGEFGITDRLQVEAEFELEQEGSSAEFGPVEIGVSYALVDGAGTSRPEVTARASVLIPSGDGPGDTTGVGFALGLGLSQQLGERLFGHLDAGYSEASPLQFGSARIESSQWSAGGALAYGFGEDWFVTTEYVWSRESERDGTDSEREVSHTASLGMTRALVGDIVIGVGGSLENRDGSDVFQARALIQVEF